MEKRTTIELAGKEFPFYQTNRGLYDFENAGYSTTDMAQGKVSAMLAFIFFQSYDCAKRANLPYPFKTLDEFIDGTSTNVIDVFARLNEASPEGESKEDAKPVSADATEGGLEK
jgi:hypothetical protein